MRNLLYLHPDDGYHDSNAERSMVIPFDNHAFDVATVCGISGILLLSLFSLSSIFYLRIRSRQFHHLENFNSFWTVRLLLAFFPVAWAANEILRLPVPRRHYLYPFWPNLTLEEEADICKVHIVLSLGFLEPSFLMTLLFLVKVSIKGTKSIRILELMSLLMVSSAVTALQMVSVYFLPWEEDMPKLMQSTSVLGYDHETVLCTYPFLSGVVFLAFTIGYAMAFLFSFWRVMELVINKGTRHRIYLLASAVMVALSVQIVCLSLSWLWTPEEAEYGLVVFAMFVFVAGSMAVGEVVLVLKPIKDALAVGGGLQSPCLL